MKIVSHSYRTSCETISTPPGLGDYLRGSIALGILACDQGFDLRLDLSQHPARKFLRGSAAQMPIDSAVAEFFDNRATMVKDRIAQMVEGESIAVLTNLLPKQELVTPEVRELVRRQFQVDESIDSDAEREIERTVGNKFAILHVRVADEHFHAEGVKLRALNKYIKRKLVPEWGTRLLVLSNNKNAKKSICEKFGLPLVDTGAVHMGRCDASEADLRDTLIDFALISKASAVYSYSVYHWKSGFSRWCACLHDVPFEGIELVSLRVKALDLAKRAVRRLLIRPIKRRRD